MLNAYLRAEPSIAVLERGRVDALRARIAWKAGALELARQRYLHVEEIGLEHDLPELRVRGLVGKAVLAQQRGSFLEVKQAATAAVKLAEENGFRGLGGLGHQMLMVAAVEASDLTSALRHAWKAYDGAHGDLGAQAERLVDLAQLFCDAGHFGVARTGFAAALRLPLPDRALFPALGGAALAAAHLGHRREVSRFADEITARGQPEYVAYATASAWLDVARALTLVGETSAATRYLVQVERLAESKEFHKLSAAAEQLRRDGAAEVRNITLPKDVARIARDVRHLAKSA